MTGRPTVVPNRAIPFRCKCVEAGDSVVFDLGDDDERFVYGARVLLFLLAAGFVLAQLFTGRVAPPIAWIFVGLGLVLLGYGGYRMRPDAGPVQRLAIDFQDGSPKGIETFIARAIATRWWHSGVKCLVLSWKDGSVVIAAHWSEQWLLEYLRSLPSGCRFLLVESAGEFQLELREDVKLSAIPLAAASYWRWRSARTEASLDSQIRSK